MMGVSGATSVAVGELTYGYGKVRDPQQYFMSSDGVRGIANVEPVTAETALKLGRAAAHVFKNLERQSRGRGKHKIVIGKDTRLSGYMLETALASGVCAMEDSGR
jgi:phosphoglucosamine mutase